MREIIFDTETTGFDPFAGDRIVEIGCVEMVNQVLTGESFHVYLNPERDMPQSAFEVRGLSSEFLRDKPKFAEIVDDFIRFVGDDSKLVAHNAGFDMKFINAELGQLSRPPYAAERVVDTLAIARRKHPMGPNSLDALCSRYAVDNSRREKHGALLDAELLAEVYVELLGGRQRGFDLDAADETARVDGPASRQAAKARSRPLAPRLSAADIEAHETFVASLGGESLWQKIWNGEKAASPGHDPGSKAD